MHQTMTVNRPITWIFSLKSNNHIPKEKHVEFITVPNHIFLRNLSKYYNWDFVRNGLKNKQKKFAKMRKNGAKWPTIGQK